MFIETLLFHLLDHTSFFWNQSLTELLAQLYQTEVYGLDSLAVHSSNCTLLLQYYKSGYEGWWNLWKYFFSSLVAGSRWSVMIPLGGYCVYSHRVYFLPFSAWLFSLFGVQYIIYLFNGEWNEINTWGWLIETTELTGLTVLIIFAIQGEGGEEALFIGLCSEC